MTKEIIYFTDNRPDPKILELCQQQLIKANLPIISVSLQPINFGKNIHIPRTRGWETYFTQILAGLLVSTADIVYFCEHDVLYPPSHFFFTPERNDTFYYNHNWVKINWPYTKAVHWDADQVSGLCCYRELAIKHYCERLANYNKDNFDRKFEPGSGIGSQSWKSPEPYVDIRQEKAATLSKWSLSDFRDKTTAKNFEITQCPEWAKQLVEKY